MLILKMNVRLPFEMNSEAVIKEKRIVGLRLRIQNESDYLFDLQTCK
jgi:hypothetical protein